MKLNFKMFNEARTCAIFSSDTMSRIHDPYEIRCSTCGCFTFESVLCRPIARPSKTEWRERERKSMKERKGEWAWKSTWTCWPLPSRSGFVPWPCPCPCPCPFLLSAIRGDLSSWDSAASRQFRTILSRMRTMKNPAAMMNSARGKLVCLRERWMSLQAVW